MGAEYLKSKGVEYNETNLAKGVEWLKKGAPGGDPKGQMFLGIVYMVGLGVERDYVKAREWLLKSEDKKIALHNIALAEFLKMDGGSTGTMLLHKAGT